MDDSTIGIRADEGYARPRLVLKDETVNVWSTVIEQLFREKRIWGHVQGTTPHPGPPLILGAGATAGSPRIRAIPEAMGVVGVPEIVAVIANPGVTQAQVDAQQILIEKWEANEAKATAILLQSLRQVDVISIRALPTVHAKWAKLMSDYVPRSTTLAMNTRNRLVNFAMLHGKRVMAMKQRLESLVDECATQLVVTAEIERTNALLTCPTPKWQKNCDSTAA